VPQIVLVVCVQHWHIAGARLARVGVQLVEALVAAVEQVDLGVEQVRVVVDVVVAVLAAQETQPDDRPNTRANIWKRTHSAAD